MKITVDRATVKHVEETDAGFKSQLLVQDGHKIVVFSLPMKLNLGEEVTVQISVKSAKKLVTDTEQST